MPPSNRPDEIRPDEIARSNRVQSRESNFGVIALLGIGALLLIGAFIWAANSNSNMARAPEATKSAPATTGTNPTDSKTSAGAPNTNSPGPAVRQ